MLVSWHFFFFFSSRRRHTRYIGDWSSDVCSSDLGRVHHHRRRAIGSRGVARVRLGARARQRPVGRSEERRVGKECGSRGGAGCCKKRGIKWKRRKQRGATDASTHARYRREKELSS